MSLYITIGIFYGSFLGIILMLLLKRREVKTGRASLFSRLGRGTDPLFQRAFDGIAAAISYVNKHTFIALVQLVAYNILLPIRQVYVAIKHRVISNPHGKKVIDAVRGRGEITAHGASFYLRRIAADQSRK